MIPIDWEDKKTLFLCNPRSPQIAKARELLSFGLKGHLWIASSGSVRRKWVALSKQAMLHSAQNVNAHLDVCKGDVWAHPLPYFHVGGMSILARGFLSKTPVFSFEEKWDAQNFWKMLADRKATLTALVPTHLYDLVQENLAPPAGLRAVLIGGDALPEPLYKRAQTLGWPLLPTYGMTEIASQVATAKEGSQDLQVLPHIEIKITKSGRLALKGPSLLTTYAIEKKQGFTLKDPKKEGWLLTGDLGEVSEGILTLSGRLKDFIKIGGESVNVARLQKILGRFAWNRLQEVALVPMPDARLGHVIHLVCTGCLSEKEVEKLRNAFNTKVHPFERVRHVHRVPALPRTPLGKLLTKSLISLLSR